MRFLTSNFFKILSFRSSSFLFFAVEMKLDCVEDLLSLLAPPLLRELLTPADIENYERKIAENLPADCAHWLTTGEMPG